MRALWKGAISFGLVTIPVSLYPAVKREELKFRLLRKSDLSPVNYKRIAEADGKEVPWDQIVKGYEYEKGKFVVIRDEDFARADVEATQTIDIISFVALNEVDPLLFYKPYYLETGKGGDKAYVLLRDALVESGKIAIARVVIRARQHLAAVKPQKKGLMLELMHFPEELLDASEFKEPAEKALGKAEHSANTSKTKIGEGCQKDANGAPEEGRKCNRPIDAADQPLHPFGHPWDQAQFVEKTRHHH